MKFKEGDKVKVKKNLTPGKDYGWFSFRETMEEHTGEVVTIQGIDPRVYEFSCRYRIERLGRN